MKPHIPFIILSITIIINMLIAIFRNQLSGIGDVVINKLTKREREKGDVILTIIYSVSLIIILGIVAYYYFYKPFDKATVLIIALGIASIPFFSLLSYVNKIDSIMQKQIDELKLKSHVETQDV